MLGGGEEGDGSNGGGCGEESNKACRDLHGWKVYWEEGWTV